MRKSGNICILGAGFGGLNTALTLEKKLGQMHSNWKIFLIDRQKFHLYTPLLYEAATGYFPKDFPGCEGQLRRGTCLSLEGFNHIIHGRKIRFLNKTVTQIENGASRKIHFEDGGSLDYDYLVLALGGEIDYFSIPGLQENSFTLKSIEDAFKIRSRVIDLCHEAGSGSRKLPLRIVVGGGGFTGVEIASEMVGLFRGLASRHGIPAEMGQITIIEAAPQVLPGVDAKLAAIAARRLRQLGIEVKINSLVVSVKQGQLVLKSGETVEADMVIWTGGVKANKLVSSIAGLELDKKGRCSVNEFLQVKGRQQEFALGDNALYISPSSGLPVPPTAQIAEQQGLAVGHNIVRHIQGRPLEKFWSHFLGFVIPMGGKYAIASLKWGTFTGWPAYLLRKLVDLKYFLKVMPWRKALGVWVSGSIVYRKND